jgi:hypothetical protein
VSLVYALGLVGLLSLRADLAELPRLWVALWGGAWLAAFVGAGWLAVVPHPGRMMPDWRAAGIAAAMASAGFVVLGLTFDRHVPGVSKLVEPGLMALARNAVGCMAVGLITAIVPVVLGAILVRGAIPVRARWVGAGLGAAGGCLGGFALHLHCHIADKLHVGLAHGGVVALAAVLGALVIPRAAR